MADEGGAPALLIPLDGPTGRVGESVTNICSCSGPVAAARGPGRPTPPAPWASPPPPRWARAASRRNPNVSRRTPHHLTVRSAGWVSGEALARRAPPDPRPARPPRPEQAGPPRSRRARSRTAGLPRLGDPGRRALVRGIHILGCDHTGGAAALVGRSSASTPVLGLPKKRTRPDRRTVSPLSGQSRKGPHRASRRSATVTESGSMVARAPRLEEIALPPRSRSGFQVRAEGPQPVEIPERRSRVSRS